MYGRLAFCVVGIYIFFLTWGLLQERISTIVYVSAPKGSEAVAAKFKYFIFLNLCQSLVAMAVSFFCLKAQGCGMGPRSLAVLLDYVKVSLCSCLASPFGYESLRHLNYPTMILGKSCKLVPVMMMNVLLYRRRFETHKYVTVAMITAGVAGFMLCQPGEERGQMTNSLYGLFLLLVNLILDGTTNSCQDQLFIRHRIRSQQMMFFMNMFSAVFMLIWLSNPWNTELSSALAFARAFPVVWRDLFLFCLCGSLGQVFVFYTLEHFGSLSLVTVTVTRKVFTMLLSMLWFRHHSSPIQWVFITMVFSALFLEAFAKRGRNSAISNIKPLSPLPTSAKSAAKLP